MNPPTISLPYQLGEAYLPLLLHLLYEFKQATMIGLVASDEVGSAAQHMVAVLCSTYKCIELLAAIA